MGGVVFGAMMATELLSRGEPISQVVRPVSGCCGWTRGGMERLRQRLRSGTSGMLENAGAQTTRAGSGRSPRIDQTQSGALGSVSAHRDAARLRLGMLRDHDLQHSVTSRGIDLVRIHRVGKDEASIEATEPALGALLLRLILAFRLHA